MSEHPVKSPLYLNHEALHPKWSVFGGWTMPLEYPSGSADEHRAVRQCVGMFDVSHLGTIEVEGVGAVAAINTVLTNDLDRIGAGQAQYTLLADDAGQVIDDLIVYRRSDDRLTLVPNAANAAKVLAVLRAEVEPGVTLVDRHRETAILAVQGPQSADVLSAIGLPTLMDYMAFDDSTFNRSPVTVCRTGYTGEHGYELMIDAANAPGLWEALLVEVQKRDGLPCGLVARDTLRTEMGYPLHGHDLGGEITALQARLGWAVGWDKPSFPGRDVMLDEREAGPTRRLLGLRAVGRAIPRPGMLVKAGVDGVIGEVTSGTYSPTLETGIALALLDPRIEMGQDVVVDVRGREVAFTVLRPPFVDASPNR